MTDLHIASPAKPEPHVSYLMIAEMGAALYIVLCADCGTQFSVFGRLAPADANGPSTVEQRICEHLDQCTPGRTRIEQTDILVNRKNPERVLYKFSAKWTA